MGDVNGAEMKKPRRRRWVRRTLVVFGVGGVSLVLAVVVAAALIPRDRIARAAASRAEAALETEVAIAAVDLDLWPSPAVALDSVRVGDEQLSFAAIDRVRLRPRLIPLVFGRVLVDEIALERPRVRIVVDEGGRTGLPEIGRATDGAADAPRRTGGAGDGGGQGESVAFAVRSFRIDDGRLAYDDARDGTSIRLDGIEQRLGIEGELRGGELSNIRLAGEISIDSVAGALPGRLAGPIDAMPIAVEHDALLDRDVDRLALERLRVRLAEIALEGEGRVDALSDSTARRVDLALRTDSFDVARLIRSLPAGLLGGDGADGGDGARALPEIAGRAAIRVRVDGPLTDADSLPRVDGSVELEDIAAARRGRPVVEATGGTVVFSLDSVASRELRGRLLGEPYRASFTLRDFAEPVVAFSASGALSLARAAAAAALGDSLSLDGRLPFELRGRLAVAELGAGSMEGDVALAGARAAGPALGRTVAAEAGRLVFDGRSVRIDGLRLKTGGDALTLDARVDEWLGLAAGDSAAGSSARFDLRSQRLDLDALLGEPESEYPELLFARLAGRDVDGGSAAEAAEAGDASLPLPLSPVAVRGRIRVDRLIRAGLEYRDLDAEVVTGPDGSATVPRARFDLLGGTVELAARLEPAPDGADLALEYELTDVGAGPFFSRLTPLRHRIDGSLRLAGGTRMRLDRHALPVRDSLSADGTVALHDGRLVEWPLVRAIGDRLGLAGFDTLAFQEWTGSFRMEGARIDIDRSVQAGDRLDADMAGWFDVGGGLGFRVTAHLPRELAAGAADAIRQVATAAADSTGRVPVGLRLGGSLGEPEIALDLTEAQRAIVARGREAAREEARELQERAEREAEEVRDRAVDEALDRAGLDSARVDSLLPDSLLPDSIGRSASDSLLDRVRGALPFLRRRPAAEDTTAPDTVPPDTVSRDTVPPDTVG